MKFPRTLVAEDNPNDALLLHRAFKKAGISTAIHFVSDGREAIDYLRGKQLSAMTASTTLPGLLLLNLRMPGLDGFEVLEWLLKHPHLRPARVIVFSSAESPGDISKALALGATHSLVKPSSGGNFDSLVQSLLAQTSTEGVSEEKAAGFRGEAGNAVFAA